MNKNSILVTVVVAILVGGLAFYGGMQYQKSLRGNFSQFGFDGTRRFGNFTQGQNGNNATRPIRGEIISADDKSITVKLQDGSTKLVLFSSSTAISEATKRDAKSLEKGKEVFVVGTTNSDGSLSAQNISIGNMGFGGIGGIRPTGN